MSALAILLQGSALEAAETPQASADVVVETTEKIPVWALIMDGRWH